MVNCANKQKHKIIPFLHNSYNYESLQSSLLVPLQNLYTYKIYIQCKLWLLGACAYNFWRNFFRNQQLCSLTL